MRINTRLDEDHSRKLEQLKARLNMSLSDILKQAIDLLHAQESAEPKKKLAALLDSDFVGMAGADQDLASNYKSYVRAAVDKKYDPRR